MPDVVCKDLGLPSRTPQGVRGLKSHALKPLLLISRRTPQGVRGLKWKPVVVHPGPDSVAPRKGCVD